MADHWHSNESNSTAWDMKSKYWADNDIQRTSWPSLFCGICVLRNLNLDACSGDHFAGLQSLDSSQNQDRGQHKTWSCHSTRTLISKNNESLNGTGLWFLDHEKYVQWLHQSSAFLWLNGCPGAGKTVLVSTVIRDLVKTRRAGELVVYYFANGYYHGFSTAKAILCSILGQLLFREPILKSFKEVFPLLNDLVVAGNPLSSAKMLQIFTRLRHILRGHETLYLLLDGLDEEIHSPQERALVLELIDHASRHDPNHQIKCFISSRSTFFGNKVPNGALQVELDSNPLVRDDMSLYVRHSLHSLVSSYPSRELKELEKRILNYASGSFLILRLILRHGEHGAAESEAGFQNGLLNLFDSSTIGLDAIYASMLARLKDCNKEAALSMLRWVTFAARPLEIHELLALYEQTGVKIKEEDISTISAGLLISIDNQIRFTHLSVREYLESSLSDRWNELSEEANEMIAHTCLKLLSAEELLQSLALSTRKPTSTKTMTKLGFVPYAQSHWMFHYQRAERHSSYLAGLLHDTLEHAITTLRTNGDELDHYSNLSGWEYVESSQDAKLRPDDYRRHLVNSRDILNIALRTSAQFGLLKLTKLELDMGANPNAPSGSERQTPLCLAARSGHLEVVKLLLQRGANPLLASGSGLTPLAYALANGHYGIRDLLMGYVSEKSMDFNEHQPFGRAKDATQEFELAASTLPSYTSCPCLLVNYELRAMPEILDGNGRILPPITVSGDNIAEGELLISSPNLENSRSLSTIVKWYPGVEMYRVLNHVSKRGIDDVRKLLLTAGNREDDLDLVISLSKLLARSTF
ncbi:hypothetical protein L207DRAFT_507036 [Hyaloscypha variabilis F]|uniref:Nephrocystin 3-like N-terminal domain-containing protein n=1 Tax=Hyaloscypha variabilis (strain UAMH 11265 / GT02V1 / F) TaxID=1149755 RepID=A0A2J6S5Q5_HYAVF|nr:hypothetical protein L207DRAFT_507036 [Hyaloscypha variabilis F]